MLKPLAKNIISKMSLSEKKKLDNLQEKYKKTGDEMLEAQAAASVAMRKEVKRSAAVQKLINKGFKAEFLAFKVADELKAYKEVMTKKYNL
jgi:hypothetical protein